MHELISRCLSELEEGDEGIVQNAAQRDNEMENMKER